MEEITAKTISDDGANGSVEDVMVSRVGEYVGSTPEGEPVRQTVDAESLQAIADELNASGEELLCDVDHAASRRGLDRDTHAAGWFSRFVVDPIKGLFAKLRLTKRGRELVEGRDYRFLSPSFALGEDGRPKALTSCSLTNTPAMYDIDPILNQKPEEKLIMEISKEDLVALIKETVAGMKAEEKPAENACGEEKPAENACSEETKAENAEVAEEIKEEIKEEAAEGASSEEIKEEVKEEVKEETAEAEPEEEKEEVIKIEALSQRPVALGGGKADWESLHGKEFFEYLKKHPEIRG